MAVFVSECVPNSASVCAECVSVTVCMSECISNRASVSSSASVADNISTCVPAGECESVSVCFTECVFD